MFKCILGQYIRNIPKRTQEAQAHPTFMRMRDTTIAMQRQTEQTALDFADVGGGTGTWNGVRSPHALTTRGRENAEQRPAAMEDYKEDEDGYEEVEDYEYGYEEVEDYKFIDVQYWDENKHGEKPTTKMTGQIIRGEMHWGW